MKNKMLKIILPTSLVVFTILSGCSHQDKKELPSSNITTTNKSPQVAEKLAVLYHGITIDSADEKFKFLEETDASKKQSLSSKYETEYSLYSNNNLLGTAKGKIEGRGFDYNWQVALTPENKDYEVAITKKYEAYPRKTVHINSGFPKEFNSDSKVISEINSKYKVNCEVKELCTVDVDGDGSNEYLALVADEKNDFFAKCLVDSKYKIISYLTVFKEKNDNFNEVLKEYNLLDSDEIIDINNDGVMEIIVSLPAYEVFLFKVFTYKNGNFDGDFTTVCSLKP